MSYRHLILENVHSGLTGDKDSFVADILRRGCEVLYGERRINGDDGSFVLERDLTAQSHVGDADVMIVGYLSFTLSTGLVAGNAEWFEIRTGGEPHLDRYVEKNQALASACPEEFTVSVHCVPGEIGDGMVRWTPPLPHDGLLVGDGWPMVVPLEIGSCRPETLLYHLKRYAGFARWAYHQRSIFVFRMNRRATEALFGRMPDLPEIPRSCCR